MPHLHDFVLLPGSLQTTAVHLVALHVRIGIAAIHISAAILKRRVTDRMRQYWDREVQAVSCILHTFFESKKKRSHVGRSTP